MTHSINKRIVTHHFSNSAHHYDDVTPIQASMAYELAQSSLNYLNHTEIKSIIEIGCGTGNLTRHLVTLFPDATITAIDISQSMIDHAKKKLPQSSNINFMNADAESIAGDNCVLPKSNLIISNAAIQWFSAPLTTIRKYARLLQPGGLLSFSTFGPQTFTELYQSFSYAESELQISHTPRVLNFCSEQDWLDIFSHSEEYDIITDSKIKKQTYSSVREFLLTIKKAGASNARKNSTIYIGKDLFKSMERIYKQNYATPDKTRIIATYHILYGFLNRNESDRISSPGTPQPA